MKRVFAIMAKRDGNLFTAFCRGVQMLLRQAEHFIFHPSSLRNWSKLDLTAWIIAAITMCVSVELSQRVHSNA